MICQSCGRECERTSNVQKYCPECRTKKQAERNAAYFKKKQDGLVVGLNEEAICAVCGKPFIKNSGHQICCADCDSKDLKIISTAEIEEKNKAHKKIVKKLYDILRVYVPKGKKQDLQALAAEHGMSLNQFVNLAIQQLEEELRQEQTPDNPNPPQK